MGCHGYHVAVASYAVILASGLSYIQSYHPQPDVDKTLIAARQTSNDRHELDTTHNNEPEQPSTMEVSRSVLRDRGSTF